MSSEVSRAERDLLIASLPQIMAFKYLVEDLQAELEGLMGTLAETQDEKKTLELARLFQSLWRIVRHLREHPENLRSEIQRAQEDAQISEDPFMPPPRVALLNQLIESQVND